MARKPVVPIPIRILALLSPALLPGEAVRRVSGSSKHFVTNLGRLFVVLGEKVVLRPGTRQSRGYNQSFVKHDDGSVIRPLRQELVMDAFVGPRPTDEFGEPQQIHHVDGDILNNALSNLEYMPEKEHRRITRINNQGGAKLTSEAVWIARCALRNSSLAVVASDLAETFGVAKETARLAIKGRTWRDVPFPGDAVTVADLMHALGVGLVRAAELLDLTRPSSGRQAA